MRMKRYTFIQSPKGNACIDEIVRVILSHINGI